MDGEATLREIFDRLLTDRAADLARALDDHVPNLPADLLNQTLVSYCDTAPIEVAERLEPFVTAVTSSADPDPFDGLELLAVGYPPVDDAPTAIELDAPVDLAGSNTDTDSGTYAGGGIDNWGDFDFGAGHEATVPTAVDTGERLVTDHIGVDLVVVGTEPETLDAHEVIVDDVDDYLPDTGRGDLDGPDEPHPGDLPDDGAPAPA